MWPPSSSEQNNTAGVLLLSPPIFRSEITNVLHQKVRRGDLERSEAVEGLKQLMSAIAIDDPPGLYRRALDLAVAFRTGRSLRQPIRRGGGDGGVRDVDRGPTSGERGPQGLPSCALGGRSGLARYLLGLAARPGFEPGTSAPKADVLPLHYRATWRESSLLILPSCIGHRQVSA